VKLTREQAAELSYGVPGHWDDAELGLTVESNEQIDSRRWVSVHLLVVKDRDGKFWAATYERGLTEYQDIDPFEDESEVTFYEVEKVPVTTYEYRKIA